MYAMMLGHSVSTAVEPVQASEVVEQPRPVIHFPVEKDPPESSGPLGGHWHRRTSRELAEFEFPNLESVPITKWPKLFRQVADYAVTVLRRNFLNVTLADPIAQKIVTMIRSGERRWDPSKNQNLLLFAFAIVRFETPNLASEFPGGSATHPSPRIRSRNRSRSSSHQYADRTMDVPNVIENLPTIALLVGRLNDLLNPIAAPASDPKMEAEAKAWNEYVDRKHAELDESIRKPR